MREPIFEIAIVFAAITASIAFVVILIARLKKEKNDPCCTCTGCAFKEQMLQNGGNPCCDCKKTYKNFGE